MWVSFLALLVRFPSENQRKPTNLSCSWFFFLLGEGRTLKKTHSHLVHPASKICSASRRSIGIPGVGAHLVPQHQALGSLRDENIPRSPNSKWHRPTRSVCLLGEPPQKMAGVPLDSLKPKGDAQQNKAKQTQKGAGRWRIQGGQPLAFTLTPPPGFPEKHTKRGDGVPSKWLDLVRTH